MTWQEEAAGIEPWAGAWMFHPFTANYALCLGVDAERDRWRMESLYDRESVRDCPAAPMRESGWVVAIDAHDTLAALDRRLALRLGATVTATEQGVLFWLDDGEAENEHGWLWNVEAGGPVRTRLPSGGYAEGEGWSYAVRLPTRDPLLARCRAWRSNPDAAVVKLEPT